MEIKHYILIQYPVGFGIVSDKVWGVVTVPTLHMFLKKTYFFCNYTKFVGNNAKTY